MFIGQSYFNNDRAQCYLIFQPICKTFTIFSGLTYPISEWESKDGQMKNLSLLIQQIKIFLQNRYGMNTE